MSVSKPLIICHRAFSSGKFSIERVFDSFSRHLPPKLKVQTVRVPCSGASVSALIRNIRFCRKIDKQAIVHVSGDIHYVIPAIRGKKVLTVHDCGSILNERSKIKKWLKLLFWVRLPLRSADAVTCISEMTRRELIGICPEAASKITVISDPAGEEFHWTPKNGFPDRAVVLHFAKYVNKNTIRVIRALDGLPCRLRLIGHLSEAMRRELADVSYPWSNACNLTDKELVQEYENCDIVCFPSLYEGFGMPILEAQAVGRPVLTSDRTPMREVAGDGAQFANPEEEKSIHEKMHELLASPELRARLIEEGRCNVERFRPEKIARSYAEIYQDLQNK